MRKLTFKHMQPNNVDQMKVRFTKNLFSKEIIATLRLYQNYDHERFREINATIEFMDMSLVLSLVFYIHDVVTCGITRVK